MGSFPSAVRRQAVSIGGGFLVDSHAGYATFTESFHRLILDTVQNQRLTVAHVRDVHTSRTGW